MRKSVDSEQNLSGRVLHRAVEMGDGGHSERDNFGVVLLLIWEGLTYASEDSAVCYIKASLLA
jgi:hypothetical protein